MSLVDALGLFAASCTTLAFLPQTIKVIRERDTRGLSLGMYIVFTTGVLAWLGYGIAKQDLPIIVANAVTALLSGTILALLLRERRAPR